MNIGCVVDDSIDHILDAILKTRNMTKNFCELCTLIFKRVLNECLGRSVYEMTYVRYILVFKMWKRVVKGAEERRKVMKLAATKLIPPLQFRDKLKSGLLCGVLPKIPKSRPDITMFLMQAKFCVKEKSKAFLKVVADPKQQCVLGTSLSADLDRPLFFGDGCNSPQHSNSDDQDDTSGSSSLMNDIWSSMSLEAGIRDHLRLASVTVRNRKNNSKNTLKKKNKANTVPKEDEENKRKEKKSNKSKNKSEAIKCNEVVVAATKEKQLDEEETKPSFVLNSNKVCESCTQTVEFTPMIPIQNIKVEADSSDDVCFVGVINHDDGLVSGTIATKANSDNDSEMLDVAKEIAISDKDTSVKIERLESAASCPTSDAHDGFLNESQVANEWSPVPSDDLFNSTVRDFISGSADIEMSMANPESGQCAYDMEMEKNLPSKHLEVDDKLNKNESVADGSTPPAATVSDDISTVAAEGSVTLDSSRNKSEPSVQMDNQKLMDSFKQPNHYVEKNSDAKISTTNSHKVESEATRGASLHDKTLIKDHSVYISQQQYRALSVKELLSPPLSVPSPAADIKSSCRCHCEQCNANYTALQSNYEKLTTYAHSKLNNSYEKNQAEDEDVKSGKESRKEQSTNLPLKKRKALQTSATILRKEAFETSYPCTPMMSIAAALENSNVGMQIAAVGNVIDYSSSANTPQFNYYHNTANSGLPTTASTNLALSAGCARTDSNINYNNRSALVANPILNTNAVQPVPKFQRSFKTPAQLKEGMQSNDLSTAQDLIHFARNSQNYSNKKTTNKRPRKTRTSERCSKKRKK